jgi:hypothetical protein
MITRRGFLHTLAALPFVSIPVVASLPVIIPVATPKYWIKALWWERGGVILPPLRKWHGEKTDFSLGMEHSMRSLYSIPMINHFDLFIWHKQFSEPIGRFILPLPKETSFELIYERA